MCRTKNAEDDAEAVDPFANSFLDEYVSVGIQLDDAVPFGPISVYDAHAEYGVLHDAVLPAERR